MLRRYLFLFRSHLIILGILVALVIISSVTRGTTASTTSIIAGVLMIYAAITFIAWIIRTPSSKNKDAVS